MLMERAKQTEAGKAPVPAASVGRSPYFPQELEPDIQKLGGDLHGEIIFV